MNYDYKYVSADNHLNTKWLPEDLWKTRLPKSFVEKAPRVVETDRGSFWGASHFFARHCERNEVE